MPKSLSTAAAAAGVAVMLGACGTVYDYDSIGAIEAPADPFAKALTEGYKEFAVREAKLMYDWPDAAHFGRKAEAAAAGQEIMPEPLEDWRVPAKERHRLADGRARLISVLKGGGAKFLPAKTAQAIVRFDCWVEQQEENWQQDDIARCRDDFYAALNTVEAEVVVPFGAVPSKSVEIQPTVTPASQTGVTMTPPAVSAFTVLFDFNSTDVLRGEEDAIARVAEAAKDGADVSVILAGHADRAGPVWYNEALSRKRAEAVRAALVARGVPGEAISVTAFGERRPLISTPDGTREHRNRRVEIIIGHTSKL